jgi:hypothetical protein
VKKTALLIFFAAFAACANEGAMPFLKSGFGSRAVSMGGAFTAIADDASASYWNPAGLFNININKVNVTSMYSKLAYDRVSGFVSIYESMDNDAGALGLSWYNFTSNGIEGYDDSGNTTGLLSSSSNVFSISYANKLAAGLKGGITGKCYFSRLADSPAKGFGMDLGLLMKTFDPALEIGAVVSDLSTGIIRESGGKDFPAFSAKLGASYRIIFEKFISSAEIEYVDGRGFKAHLGAEYCFTQVLSIRAGLSGLNLTAGFGFKIDPYTIDYAFVLDNDSLGDVHKISLSAGF